MTYVPKNVDVLKFSKKLKDVNEKTNIRHFRLIIVTQKLYLICLYFSQSTVRSEYLKDSLIV